MKRTPLKKRNEKRRRRLFEVQYGGDYADLIRAMDCIVVSEFCKGPIHASHVKSRGAGGKARDLVPMCDLHHSRMHCAGIKTFEAYHLIDLKDEAASLWEANGQQAHE